MKPNKVIASAFFTNNASVNIHDIEYGIDDKVVFSLSNSHKAYKRKIEYSVKRGAFFRWIGGRWYMDDFIRHDTMAMGGTN